MLSNIGIFSIYSTTVIFRLFIEEYFLKTIVILTFVDSFLHLSEVSFYIQSFKKVKRHGVSPVLPMKRSSN